MKKLIVFTLICVMLTPIIIPVSAKEKNKKEITVQEIGKMDSSVNETTKIIEKGKNFVTYETDYVEEVVLKDEPMIQTLNWWGYSITNLKAYGSAYANKNIVVSSDDVSPGTSYTFELKYSHTTKVEGVMAIDADYINVKLGKSNTSSVTMTKRWQYTCPKLVNNKKVKYAVVTFYPKLQKYSFTEQFLGSTSGSGYATVLVGFSQQVTIKY